MLKPSIVRVVVSVVVTVVVVDLVVVSMIFSTPNALHRMSTES